MKEIIIDADNGVVGRISTYAAKQALLGNKIIIVNSEKAILSGNKKSLIEEEKIFRKKGGSALKGPFISKDPEKSLKRSIRGMLPDYRRGRGREAWKRIKCYNGVPEEYKDKEMIKIMKIKVPTKHITLKELKDKI